MYTLLLNYLQISWQNIISILLIVSILFVLILLFLWIIAANKQRLINLVKRENLYRTLFDNTGTSTILIDRKFKIILSNSEFEKLTGFTRYDLEDRFHFLDLLIDYDIPKIKSHHQDLVDDKKSYSEPIEVIIIDKKNEAKHCICNLTPIKGANQCIISLTNISEAKRNQQIILESREQFKAIVNAIPNLIFRINRDGRILDSQDYSNKDISFLKASPKPGKYIKDLFPSDTCTIIHENKNTALREIKNVSFNFSLDDNNGKKLHFESQIVPVGQMQALFILNDSTDRIEKEKTIKILGHAVKGVSECINITDENNIIQFVNRAFLDTYGYTEEEVIGKPVNMIVSSNNPNELLDEIKKARLKEGWHGEVFNVKKNGEEFPVYLSTSLVQDDESKTIAIFAVAIDISERIRQTNNVKRLNKELSEKNTELEQIIYIASHDLRSPLINIEGFSYELSKVSKAIMENLSGEHKVALKEIPELFDFFFNEMPGCIEYIQTSTKKMDTLIAGLLKISRLGRSPVTLGIVNMNDLIKNVVKNFSFQISQKQISLTINDLPDCYGDAVLINQLFSNLLSNSINYMSTKNKPIIEIGGSIINENILYHVKDNGIGIPETKLEEVFKIFYRLTNDNTGDGLGLSIVKKIADRHNGRIWAENNADSGCTFFFEIPSNMNTNIETF